MRQLFPWLLLAAACAPDPAPVASGETNLIEGANVIDGSGAPGFTGDVRFDGSGILAIGDLEPIAGDTIIDGSGLTLAPGFIDTHSHHDWGLAEATDVTAAISQGITTIVVGNDGSSNFPLRVFMEEIESDPPTLNVSSYTGHGTIRFEVMGEDFQREATDEEVAAMQALLDEEMHAGSLGLATGLEYDPGIYSDTDEVIALAEVAATHGGRYISHMRSEDRAFHDAVEELLLIGREADLPVQISHMKLASLDIWGQAGQVLERLDAARAEGIDVTADVYPYTFWQSTLTVLLPERDFDDIEAARYALTKLAPPEGLTLSAYSRDPSLVGRTVAEIAAVREQSPEEAYLQLIRDAYEGMTPEEIEASENRIESVLGVSMSEEDIATLIAWPHANICSDGASTGHPRGHGAFPRAIRQFVREQGLVSLEEMIRKMTSLSAAHVGITGRGLIRPGYAADLVLFDAATITDNATIEKYDALSDGIASVWVNGERVWMDRKATAARPGIFIERPRT